MSKELVISANRHEIKLGILEDDQLVEVFFQRSNEYSLAGSIHKGRVTRVLPGMQSAFVDLGLERDTFLYVSDFSEEGEDFDRVSVSREPAGRESSRGDRGSRPPVERSERPPAQQEAAPEGTGAEVTPSAGAPEPPPLAAPRNDRNDRGDRGEDGSRGRRSRRRRNRGGGRGFPDSKYASEVSRPPRIPEAGPAVESTSSAPAPSSSAAPVSAGATDFSVLPGESLAKYTRSNIQPLDDAEEEEIRDLQEAATPEPEAAAELLAEEVAEVAEEAEEEPDDAPIAEDTVAGEPEVLEIEILETEEVDEVEVEESTEESTSEVENESGVEAGGESAAFETPMEAGAEPPATGAAPLSAQVREQGGRYMHRLPRRMRRKMRGGGQVAEGRGEGRGEARPDARATDEPRAEGAATEPAAGRPEPRTFSRPEKAPLPSITELLKEGQEIIVQIAKEPLGQKGARITSHIALPGRYVVYMPTLEHTGVSRKIASDDERLRLKRILQVHHAGIPGGFIVRTAGEGKSEEDLAADMNFLFNLWLDIRQKAEKKPAPLLLHHDLDIVQRTLRDQFTEDFKAIWVDNEELYESVLRFVQRFQPALVTRVKLYTRPEPIFDAFNITAELEKALRPKVWLKSGGYIVINQTEALVAIDVNTGKFVGRSNRLEDTIVKTNTEAVKEIVRQVRLRDLGGIIVVDFIDMDERKNRQKVMQVLEDAMRTDRAPYKILQFNDFGLVAITRKRVKQSLERALCMPCPHCEGAGYVKSVQTIVSEILQEAGKLAAAIESKDVMLRVHPDVAKYLKSNQNKSLEEIEEVLRRPVLVKADPLLHHEKFDLG
ncbi:MAG TPA: Rne/Rng family ribonuclease [Bryobacteraceae bacterium]|nr:Rne/Rng family ribonuclease [Bryobacteraceae bacterium]